MSQAQADYSRGWDAYIDGEDFDNTESSDWHDGYFDAQNEDAE
jgi:hypothetical protein